MSEAGYVYVMYQGPTVLGVYSSIAAADRNAPKGGAAVTVLKHLLDDSICGTFQRVLLPSHYMSPIDSPFGKTGCKQ